MLNNNIATKRVDAVKINAIRNFFYRKITGGSFKDALLPCHCAFYNDGGKFGIISGNRITWIARGEMIVLEPSTPFRPVAEGLDIRLFFCAFEAEERLRLIPSGQPSLLSTASKNLLASFIGSAREIFPKEKNEEESSSFEVDPEKVLDSDEEADPAIIQRAFNSLELILLDSVIPAHIPLRSIKEGEYSFESERITDEIISYLQNNLTRKISLDEIKDELYFSKSYIKQVFKKQTGSSILAYHTAMRIERAKKMLAEGKNTAEIALSTGFSSQNHFSSVFKKTTGFTPTEYKKTLKS
ncbi:MAG: helix-turn-helix transcriptional regulator [Clostridia bacterium]|nr:helix-turn-helix transcriptional regulator [Clostridia bacterium]